MGSLRRILALVVKELLALLKDRRSRTVVIVPPIVQTIVFGYAATFDLENIPYAVWDEDRSAASRELLAGLEGSETFHLVRSLRRHAEIADVIDRREALVVVHVAPDFERELRAGRSGKVQVIADGRNSNTASIALRHVREVVDGFNRRWARRGDRPGPPVRPLVRAWFNPNLRSRWFIVSGLVGLLTLVVTTLVTSLSVAREREQGTFDQLLVTPYRPAEILAGKTLPGFLIGILEASFLVLLAVLWFEVPFRGSVLTLYAGLGLFILSAVGTGLMISSLAVTMQQGLLGAFLFLVPSVILSGFATPIANMPAFVRHLTLLNPLRYLMTVLRAVFLEGASAGLLVSQLWPMAAIGAATLTAAAWLFRRRMH